jgi:hypothetical protein
MEYPRKVESVTGQILECARAEALFVSYVQRSDTTTADTIRSAIRHSVRQHGTRGCAEMVAHEFGEHPETAVGRMTWALRTVRGTYTTAA